MLNYSRRLHDLIIQTDQTQIDQTKAKIDAILSKIKEYLDAYRKTDLSNQEKSQLTQFDTAWAAYLPLANQVIAHSVANDNTTAVQILYTQALPKFTAGSDLLTQISNINDQLASETHDAAVAAFNMARNLIFGLLGAAILIGFGIAFYLSRDISRPMAVLIEALDHLQHGDLNRDTSEEKRKLITGRSDEIGLAGQAEAQTGRYMREMADVANRLAEGDLTVNITPKSDKDELGQAFAQMITSLRGSIGQVAENAFSLGSASAQLSNAASKAGEATSQIATTIQEVANGTTQQTASVTRTATSVEEVSASAEEMSAQVEEVTASAASLAEMADVLRQIVAQFKLTDEQQTVKAAPQAARPAARPAAPSGPSNGKNGNGHHRPKPAKVLYKA